MIQARLGGFAMNNNYRRLALSAIAFIIFIAIGTHARAAPVEYVRICDAYGSGFYYIPGTDTCLKLGGYERANGDLSHAMTGANMQFLGYLGSSSVRSFGSDYDATVFFGKASFGFRFPNYFRLQADAQMEATDGYCAGCGSASYFAGILHLNWNPVSNIDFGLFGGAADVSPTFFAPKSTIGIAGVEARYFTNNWMVGGQLGWMDLSSGTGAGILTDAWFIEGRVQYSLGTFAPQLRGLGIRATYGYASGKVAGGTISADSTQWSVGTLLSVHVDAFDFHRLSRLREPRADVRPGLAGEPHQSWREDRPRRSGRRGADRADGANADGVVGDAQVLIPICERGTRAGDGVRVGGANDIGPATQLECKNACAFAT